MTLPPVLVVALVIGQVELRGPLPSPSGVVTGVGPEGVTVSREGAAPAVIGWDRVLSLGGEFAGAAEPFLGPGELLWRARTRLGRGDTVAAEPLFEELFAAGAPRRGPTAGVVAEGLLRCRLRRGALTAAVPAWLALLRASGTESGDGGGGSPRSRQSDWSRDAGLPPILDTDTALLPSLPPIWLPWPAVESYARAGTAGEGDGLSGEQDDRRAGALDALYLHAARFEAGIASTLPVPTTGDAGVALVAEIVAARTGSPDERSAARSSLRARLDGSVPPPGWVRAWCRTGVGISLLREESADDRRLGVIELLQVPAEFEELHPYLAGLALAHSVVALERMGDIASASILRAELFDRYPDHPGLEWEPIRQGGPAPATPAPSIPGAKPPASPAVHTPASPTLPDGPPSPREPVSR